jgi:hypothetical protein
MRPPLSCRTSPPQVGRLMRHRFPSSFNFASKCESRDTADLPTCGGDVRQDRGGRLARTVRKGAASHPLGASAMRQGFRIGCAVRNDEGAGRLLKEAIHRRRHGQFRISSFRTARLIRNTCLAGSRAERADDETQDRCVREVNARRPIRASLIGDEIRFIPTWVRQILRNQG